jgi:hypothetical protein
MLEFTFGGEGVDEQLQATLHLLHAASLQV